ncbi:uncharacterized protein LOC62_01G001671 [Vanrija pseudolonga]|uniref:Uncharacterized protein n=1 Tax=Vanrija pseudolonga TaxID=143232 RepID=A0AAF1BNH7_9TREE|nr:hypothetical protein LOC62_01G001671 [Vanrija pseudolonga]
MLQLLVEFTARSAYQLCKAFLYILLGTRMVQVTLVGMIPDLTALRHVSLPSAATVLDTLRYALRSGGFYLALGVLVILLEDILSFIPGTSLLALGLHVLVRIVTVAAVAHFVPGATLDAVFALLLAQYYHRWVEPELEDMLELRAAQPPTVPGAYPPQRKITFGHLPTPPPPAPMTPQEENDARIVERINTFIPHLFDYLCTAPPRITLLFGRLIAEVVLRVALPDGPPARLPPKELVRALKRAIDRQVRLVKTSRDSTSKAPIARTLAIITVVQGMREVYEIAFRCLPLYPKNPVNNPGIQDGRHEFLVPLLEIGADAVDLLLEVLGIGAVSMVTKLGSPEADAKVQVEMAGIEKVVKDGMDDVWAGMVLKAIYASPGVELIAHLAKGEDNWEPLIDSAVLETFRHTGARLLSNKSEAGIWHAAARLLKWCSGTDDRRKRNTEAKLLGIGARATTKRGQPSANVARELLSAMRYPPFDGMFGLRSLFPEDMGEVKADWQIPGLRLHRNGVPTEIKNRSTYLLPLFPGFVACVLREYLDKAATSGSDFLRAARAAFVVIQAMEERVLLAAVSPTSPHLGVRWAPAMEAHLVLEQEDEGASDTADPHTGDNLTRFARLVAELKTIAAAHLSDYVTAQGVILYATLMSDCPQAVGQIAAIQERIKSSMSTAVAKVLCEAIYASFAAELMGAMARNRRLSDQDISAEVPGGVVMEWGRQVKSINSGTPPLWSSMMTFMRWYTGSLGAGSSGLASRLKRQCAEIASTGGGGGSNADIAAQLHKTICGAPLDRRYRIDTLYPATLASAKWNNYTGLALLEGKGVKFRVMTLLALEKMCRARRPNEVADGPRLQAAARTAAVLAHFVLSNQDGGNKVLQLVVARRLAGIIIRVDSDPAYVFKLATQLRSSARRALHGPSGEWSVAASVETVLSALQAMQERGLLAGQDALAVPGFAVLALPVPRAARLRCPAGSTHPGVLQDIRDRALLRLHKWLNGSARNAVRTMFGDPDGAVQAMTAIEEDVRERFPRDIVAALFAYVAANIIKELASAEAGSVFGWAVEAEEAAGTPGTPSDLWAALLRLYDWHTGQPSDEDATADRGQELTTMRQQVKKELKGEWAGVVVSPLLVAAMVMEALGLPPLDQSLGLGSLFAATLPGAREHDQTGFDPALVEAMGAERIVAQVEELEEMCRGEERE